MVGRHSSQNLAVGLASLLVLLVSSAYGFSTTSTSGRAKSQVSESAGAQKRISHLRHRRRHHYYERFYTSSFADDVTAGDITDGEDLSVRTAAIDALGNMNGSVVAIDPASGRILAMVNQKLALSEGAQPCSTFKVAVALAALKEGLITKDDEVRLGRRTRMNLTDALAHSNNAYFEALGRRLGFKRVSEYAHMFGMGELAGFNIEGEHLGQFPTVAPGTRDGGVGKLCSYGETISMTPLQLGAMMVAVANGGTLYYLQHPQSADEIAGFVPKVKRQLEINDLIPDVSEGMAGAVAYGTARSVRYNFDEEEILGKTGTCSKDGTRFGWFASYANTDHGKVVIVVFLRGGRPTFGPKAAEIAGRMYHNLYSSNFFVDTKPQTPHQPATGVAVGISQ
ncbi:MAG TPA: penicillin-binding transpeptidase domain-containing protein [Terriglobales bacterium]|jgi:penicillin-binding protein 2|nr:penicillin-binding transpeptidase domain-containing protein [Terriglobales bacterium]